MSEDWNEVRDLNELEKEIDRLVDRSYVEELLKMQLAEYEMLESMFSNPGEFNVDDYSILADFNDYLEGKTSVLPPRLNYTIRTNIGDKKFEICINLPLEYPNIEPDIFVRSENLNRNQQKYLNKDLANYISDLNRGDVCVYGAVDWLQENALQYFNVQSNDICDKVVSSELPKDNEMFTRYWIYSHHIYSKIKRREILDLAQEYRLTGFSLPGRPGIICLEGYASDCEEWWQKIKSMTWKKIMCKKKEEIKINGIDIDKLRKFSDFKEISFENGKNRKRDFHMDFGEFCKYLSDHNCKYIFKDYFGIDGK